MADQNPWDFELALQKLGGGDEIRNIGGEIRLTEISITFAQTGEVETQNSDPFCRQGTADVSGCFEVLRTSETVGEQSIGQRLAIDGQIETCGEFFTLAVFE